MIFKKPYAFLIKQFRIIHIILVALSIYIMNKSSSIYTFFTNYIDNNYSATITSDFSSNFIDGYLFLALIFLVGSLFLISFLLSLKKKSNKFYIISMIFYIILIIYNIYYITVFNSMENSTITADAARIYHDISLLFYLPQYAFIIFYSVRALGFNVKQFNFKDDLKEIKTTSEDNEEVELNIEFDAHKTKRTFRRFLRETKYYIRENLIFIVIISIVLTVTFTYNIVTNFSYFKDNNYTIGDTFYYDGFYITILDADVSNTDLGGDVIAENKSFVVLTIEIENPSTSDLDFDSSDCKLLYNNELIEPSNEYANKFSDYGSTLLYSNIKYSSTGIYTLVYVIDPSDVNDSFKIKLFTGTYEEKGIYYPVYTIVSLDTDVLINEVESGSAELEEKIIFSNTKIGESNYTINNYEISDIFYYKYEKCTNSVCNDYTSSIFIDLGSSYKNKTILKLESELNLDTSTIYYSNNKSNYEFFDNFVTVNYTVGEATYTSGVTSIRTTTNDDSYYLYVDEKIENADNIELIITIRNKKYTYTLK